MLSALFLINQKGEIVIYRFYRDDVTLSAANAFRLQVRCVRCSVRDNHSAGRHSPRMSNPNVT